MNETRRRLLQLLAASPMLNALRVSATEALRRRPIPSTGEALPVVGLGTWQTFDVGSAAQARAGLRQVLELLVNSGARVVDSSPMYGSAESVVGDLAAELGVRDDLFMATKVWTRGKKAGIGQMSESLARFRTDYLDLMQIHNLLDWKTHLETLRRWKDEGKIRYSGITHYTVDAHADLAEIIASRPIDFLQVNYSILTRAAEDRLLPLAADRGVAVIINRPFEGGGLFRRVRDKQLPDWAQEIDCATWGQFFLKFILSHPAVTCVIPGTRRVRHLQDNLDAGRGRLPDRDMRERMAETIAKP